MEDSAFEAIYTGVYIFVFLAALTTTLYMFRNVNEVAERSYEYGRQVQGQAVIEAPTEDKVYLTESEVISYYFNYIRKDIYADAKDTEDITITIEGLTKNNLNYNKVLEEVKGESYYIRATGADSFEIKKV